MAVDKEERVKLEFSPHEAFRWGPDPLLTMFGSGADVTVEFEVAGTRDQVSGVLAALTEDAVLVEQQGEGSGGVAFLVPRSRVVWVRAEFTVREADTATNEDRGLQRNSARRRRVLAELDARSLTLDEVAATLGVDGSEIDTLVAEGGLLVIETERGRVAPAWQFHEGRLLPGLEQLVEAYPYGPEALAQWAEIPNPALDAVPPAQLLAEGNIDRVIAIARAGL